MARIGIFNQNKDNVIKWYMENKLSGVEITKMLDTKNKKIYKFLRDCGVKVRNKSEARNGMKIPPEVIEKTKQTKKLRNSYNPFCHFDIQWRRRNKGKTYEEIHGKKMAEEIKKKLSKTLTGRKGWKPTSKQKINHSIRMRGKNAGKKNYFWKGGVYHSPYHKDFDGLLKLTTRSRDKFTCQECGDNEEKLGYKLHIHHIDSNKENNKSSNLISLCRKCHGKTQYKKKDWIKYYKDKMEVINWHE